MAGIIPQQFIDDLLSRSDIVDVINQRVPLKKAGPEYKACCPFHDEKTPSFTVSPSKQFYHCFGCGAHGSAIGFLMEYDGLAFPEAVEELANHLGIDVPREGGSVDAPDNRPLYHMLEQAARYFSWQLRKHPNAPQAASYLRQRGLSGEIANEFQIGYAPPGWDNLLKQLGDSPQATAQLRDTGLISEPDGKRYDRFRNRIMFPIHDNRGRVVGFGGRVLDDSTPKYLNSPETAVFHKGRELYGLYEAHQALKHLDQLLVVEGYMDVVALAQFGIRNVVATLGTATTAEQLEKLFRAAPEIVFCFDGDRAGREAAWKALGTALPMMRDGRQARFLFLSEGDDPDSLVRRIGQEAFLQQIQQAQALSEFFFQKLTGQVDMQTIDGHARLVELARPYLKRLPVGVFRDLMEKHLADLAGTDQLRMEQQSSKVQTPRKATRAQPGTMRPVHRAIALLLQHPHLAALPNLPQSWQHPESKGKSILNSLLETLNDHPHLSTAALVERWEDPDTRRHLGKLATIDLETHDDEADQFLGTLANMARDAQAEELSSLQEKLRPSDMTDEEKQRLRELFVRRDDKSE